MFNIYGRNCDIRQPIFIFDEYNGRKIETRRCTLVFKLYRTCTIKSSRQGHAEVSLLVRSVPWLLASTIAKGIRTTKVEHFVL